MRFRSSRAAARPFARVSLRDYDAHAMSGKHPIGFTPPPVAAMDRTILHEVALAYRRARRAGDLDPNARDAAIDRYLERRPGAAQDRLAASARVAHLIANAVAADPRWFWHGTDA